ncbi:hypothetical protein Q5424_09360 [Conexibacter sp. JD483]|uniref:hypothetical protein n=1 Tax=unclassified Conexibacter TaxID=2627773 RepID=UPI0027281EB6|nr:MULTISPECIES: hypothetical protein [unclassified Conexibacter]MDO8187216.1 hypothetical protein [Conexibacter sp. CPCC 205706]MDO8199313.1 hypothetical protein [Conexibacter sp. CPCC 205762]MDR9369286.1 hypothetical protein [Conexibacter sp. JD483]
MSDTPHLSLPLRLDRSAFARVEQDSAQHVAECVEAAARTELGWRLEVPDFGVPSYLMAVGGVDVDELREALLTSEPRAATVVELVDSLEDLRAESIRILIEEES